MTGRLQKTRSYAGLCALIGFLLVWPAYGRETLAGIPLAPPRVAQAFAAEGSVQLAFSPWEDAEGLIVQTIAQARQQILVQAYLFSNRAITQALIAAQQRGVQVLVLVDGERLKSSTHSRVMDLLAAGIPVLQDAQYQNAHNKVMVVDATGTHPAVITGSFNFTQTAQRGNAENVIVLRDHPQLAKAFAQNWHRHAQQALPVIQQKE